MSSHRTLVVTSCFSLALLSAGCRPSNIDRLPVHGTVQTAAGDKLNASITFLPDDGKKRPAASASVTEGEYRFDRTNGPTAGRTKVLIRRIDGRQRVPTPQTKTNRKTPTKSEWTKVVNVADDGKYLQDFTLEN